MRRSATVFARCLRVDDVLSTDYIDLPLLEAIQLGNHALHFKHNDDSTTLIMRSDGVSAC